MTTRSWLISQLRLSRLFGASALIGAMLLLSSQAALAQFAQDGSKLVGMLASGAAEQGASVALSGDGNTAIVGGSSDNGAAGAAWVFARHGAVWTQQSGKLVGTGAVGAAYEGQSVALSADGDTAIVGGPYDNSNAGAAWVFTRSGGVWSQQGSKLVGSGAVGAAYQGQFVALSADGATAIVGGYGDNSWAGAAWVFTRSGGAWSQLGGKLVGTGAVNTPYGAEQGYSVSLSADGDTAIVGGWGDNSWVGAAWVFTRSGGVWSQQGGKLVGTGNLGPAQQGYSVALSADGATAIVGGNIDHGMTGAAWMFTRSGGVWTQQGGKLLAPYAQYQGFSVALSADGNTAIEGGPGDNNSVGAAWVFTRNGGGWSQQPGGLVGTGAVGAAQQGYSVALSGDGNVAFVGAPDDNGKAGAAWVFVQPLNVTPYPGVAASGTQGGTFKPSSFSYKLSAASGSVTYAITGVPSWLTASSTSGTVTKSGKTIAFRINSSARTLAPGVYVGAIQFNNADGAQAAISRAATLTVNPKQFTITVRASPAAGGAVSGGGSFAQGTSQTVQAAANSGYEFVHWTKSGKAVSTSASYTFTLDASVTLIADFRRSLAEGAIE